MHLPHKSPAEYIIPGFTLNKRRHSGRRISRAKNRTKLVSVSDRLMTPNWSTSRIKCPKFVSVGEKGPGRSVARVADPQEECWFMGRKLVRSRAKRTVTVISCKTHVQNLLHHWSPVTTRRSQHLTPEQGSTPYASLSSVPLATTNL